MQSLRHAILPNSYRNRRFHQTVLRLNLRITNRRHSARRIASKRQVHRYKCSLGSRDRWDEMTWRHSLTSSLIIASIASRPLNTLAATAHIAPRVIAQLSMDTIC